MTESLCCSAFRNHGKYSTHLSHNLPVVQRHRAIWSVGTHSAVQQVLGRADGDEVDDVRPSAVRVGFRVEDARAGHVHVEAQVVQDQVEQVVSFHAVAPDAFVVHNLLEQVRWPDGDGAVPGVVHRDVLPWDFTELMLLEEVEKCEFGIIRQR